MVQIFSIKSIIVFTKNFHLRIRETDSFDPNRRLTDVTATILISLKKVSKNRRQRRKSGTGSPSEIGENIGKPFIFYLRQVFEVRFSLNLRRLRRLRSFTYIFFNKIIFLTITSTTNVGNVG